MHDLIINTGPIIAITAALGNLEILDKLYQSPLIPREVYEELLTGGQGCREIIALTELKRVVVADRPLEIPNYLNAVLDRGEASVIQTAMNTAVPRVAIDEKQGRRIARLHELKVTGSVGILVKATIGGLIPDLEASLNRMRKHGIWISEDLVKQALTATKQ